MTPSSATAPLVRVAGFEQASPVLAAVLGALAAEEAEVRVSRDPADGASPQRHGALDVLVCSESWWIASAAKIREAQVSRGRDLPIVAVTARESRTSELELLELGVSEVVPVGRIGTSLLTAVRRAAARGRARGALENRLRQHVEILEVIRDGVYESDARGVLTFVNPALVSILDAPAAPSPLGRSFLDFVHPSHVDDFEAALARALESGPGADAPRVRTVTRKGREIEVEVRPAPQRRGGPAVGSRGIVRDVTAEVAADRNLDLLSRAIEESPAAVLIADDMGKVVYVNSRWSEVTGVAAEEVVGRPPGEVRAGIADASIFEGLWEAVLRKSGWRGRVSHRDGEGSEHMVDTVITPIGGRGGRVDYFLSFGIDVTEIAALHARLATVDKWQAIGQIAGGIAHDLNNHLGVALASADIARGKLHGAAAPGLREDLEAVIAAARAGKQLVQSILASSRRSRISPEAASLGALVDQCARALQEEAGPGIVLRVDVRPGAPVVAVDRAALRQILAQLVANARDAMPDGGLVHLEVGPFFVDEAFHSGHPWCPMGAYAQVRITDTGTGMDESTLQRAFEMFFTTKGPERASGLGLPAAFGLMKQHDGFMLVESRPGAGTSFQLLFPAAESLWAAQVPEPAARAPAASGRQTVLYVEDNDRLRRAGRRALEEDGFAVLEARDGVDALEQYAAHEGEVDVVISDLLMPRLGGAELYRRLTERYGSVPFIITSGHVDEDPEFRDHLPADVPYLLKPWGVEELTQAVAAVAGRAGPWSNESGAS
ncbi:MAG TPA: PAS domain-containing protein [Longimicrobiales bacterium]|nr:PAS domain-containing protein [Longimicrobiales bacterium]